MLFLLNIQCPIQITQILFLLIYLTVMIVNYDERKYFKYQYSFQIIYILNLSLPGRL